MSFLNRENAPFGDDLWSEIEAEALDILQAKLTAREAVDVESARGLELAAVNTGRKHDADNTGSASFAVREALPVVELEVPFTIDRSELKTLMRGGDVADLDPIADAAEELASAENQALFYGLEKADVEGVISSAEQPAIDVEDNLENFAALITSGITSLQQDGVTGPYSLVVDPGFYNSLQCAYTRGYPLERRLKSMLNGEIILNSDLEENGVLVSRRGEDFKFIPGQKLSIGYRSHSEEEVNLFFFESFAVQIDGPEAAVPLS